MTPERTSEVIARLRHLVHISEMLYEVIRLCRREI